MDDTFHGHGFFDAVSLALGGTVNGLTTLLLKIPTLLLLAALVVLAFVLRRSWPLAVFVAAALLFILNQGYWAATLETLALVAIATVVSTAIGIPIRCCARSPFRGVCARFWLPLRCLLTQPSVRKMLLTPDRK